MGSRFTRVPLLLAFVIAMACGGGGSSTGQSASPNAVQAQTAAPTASTAAPAAAATPAGPSFVDVIGGGKLASYKVSYRVSIIVSGQTLTTEQTWYSKPPKSRFDYSVSGAGSFSTFVLEDGAYFCTSFPGLPASCQKTSEQEALAQNQGAFFDLQVREHPDQFGATYTGTRTIAGQQAQCFGLKSGVAVAGFAEVTNCYGSTGIALLQQMKGQGLDWTMEATSFSTTVSDTDFKLPVPP